MCEYLPGEAHRADEHHVDAIAADGLLGGDPLGLTGDQARPADAVRADIHKGPSVQCGAEADVRGVVRREAERSPDHPDSTYRAAVDELLKPGGLGMVAVHERLHQEPSLPLGDVERVHHFGRTTAQRLLAQHMLTGLERAHRPLDVERVGKRYVHHLDLGIRKQRLVGAECASDPVILREALGGLLAAAGHCDHFDSGCLACTVEEQAIDPRRRDDSPLHGHGISLAPGPGLTSIASSGAWASGGSSPRTLPPKPPPIIRAPSAPARFSRRTACSTAGVEIS